jgi:two-component system, OmpR family, sensor histidine kinase KdpD
MLRGDIYPVDRAQRALAHFFRPGNLIALRELALRQVTRVVDRSLDAILEKDATQQAHTVRERIGVCVSSNPGAQYLIARGSRMAQAMGGEFYVFYIDVGRDTRPEDQKSLAENLRFAQNLGATVERAVGSSVADGVAKFVKDHHITQVIFGRSARTGWQRYLYLSAIQRFLRDSPSVDVHIVTQEAR